MSNRESILVSSSWLSERLGDPKSFEVSAAQADSNYRVGHLPGAL